MPYVLCIMMCIAVAVLDGWDGETDENTYIKYLYYYFDCAMALYSQAEE